jgi:hypothetical protein
MFVGIEYDICINIIYNEDNNTFALLLLYIFIQPFMKAMTPFHWCGN